MNNKEYQYTHIAGAATTQVFIGRGLLQAITINDDAAGSITVSDSTSAGTPAVAIIQASAGVGTYWYNCSIASGLRITTAGATDITITWAQG